MRLFSIPPPTLLAGFLAVLIGYASSAAIIWQAAIVAGATTAQISGWMTALGLAMGVSTLTLTLWYRVPVLTAWSTPGAALLVTGLQGLTLNEAIGVFIVTNALIVLCGITGLFARLMRIIPHSLAAAMLAGILLRFGLQAFASLDGQFTLCGSMLLVWLATKAVAPRYAVIAAMIIGIVIVIAQGDVVTTDVVFKPVLPTYITPDFSFAHSLSVALPLFLVTMASQNAPGTDVPLTAGLADSDIFHNTRDLTAVPVAHPAQFRQKNTAVFLIELNALRVAECIILSPLFESGKSSPLPEEVFVSPLKVFQ